jgi:hypothetical protein
MGGHKALCKALLAARAVLAAAEREGGSEACEDCTVCLEGDPPPIQSGCGCRGDAGLAHIGCRVTAAEHAIQSKGPERAWDRCATCGQAFSGFMRLGLMSERLRRALRLPETARERLGASRSLAYALAMNGKVLEAEAILRDALAVAARVWGNDDEIVLQSSITMADILRRLHKVAESDTIMRRCYADSVRLYGPHDSRTMTCAQSLASSLSDQGKDDGALPIFRANLEASARSNGPEHIVTLSYQTYVANSLMVLSRFDEAEAMYSENLPIVRRVLGPEHPTTLATVLQHAVCVATQGRIADAEAMLVETLAVMKRVLGAENQLTLETSSVLAQLRSEQQ